VKRGEGRSAVEVFADAAVHALRTPLAAVSGEVELALRRERSPEAYRDALARIGQCVAELIDLTADLAILGSSTDVAGVSRGASRLGAVLGSIVGDDAGAGTVIEGGAAGVDVDVIGDQAFLARSLRLLLQHATRHVPPGGRVTLRVERVLHDRVELTLTASPPLVGQTWRHLREDSDESGDVNAAGLLRLGTAARIVEHCGGAIRVDNGEAAGSVRITLRRVPAEAHGA